MFGSSLRKVLPALVLVLSVAGRGELALADSLEQVAAVDTARFTLYFGGRTGRESEKPEYVKDVAERALEVLGQSLDEFSRIFGTQPTEKVVLRFLTPEEFRRQTGAPAWTSAMFYRGEITIPLPKGKVINTTELRRALRHEFVHAVIAELSAYRCPAWLDEGVAQLLEGQPNPLLGPALRKWIHDNDAMPLSWLQNGFTTLDPQIVPAAYAQSLFATRTLVKQFGFAAVVDYLDKLKGGHAEEEAFRLAFKRSEEQFLDELTRSMKAWSVSDQFDP